MSGITVEVAQKGIAAGLAKAKELKSPSSIAIVDAGRNLLAFQRMDEALLASIEISQAKAFTARSLNMKTGDVMQYVQPGAALYGMETSLTEGTRALDVAAVGVQGVEHHLLYPLQ